MTDTSTTDTKKHTGNSGPQGLIQKFHVERLVPSSRGIDHSECEYFVLDPLHDPLAYSCLVEYARTAAQTGQQQLAADTFRWLADLAEIEVTTSEERRSMEQQLGKED